MLKNKKKPLKILICFFKKAIQKNKIKNKTRWPGLLKKPKCLDLLWASSLYDGFWKDGEVGGASSVWSNWYFLHT